MSTSASVSGNTQRDDFKDKAQRKKKRRTRRVRKESTNTVDHFINKPASKSSRTDTRSPQQQQSKGTQRDSTSSHHDDTNTNSNGNGENDGWQIAGKKRNRRNKKPQRNANGKNGKKGNVNGRNRANRGSANDKAHIAVREQRRNTRDDVKEQSMDSSSKSTPRGRRMGNSGNAHSDDDHDDDPMGSRASRESTESTDTVRSVTDTVNSNSSTSMTPSTSSDSVNEENGGTLNEQGPSPSALDPEIAEFDPSSFGTAGVEKEDSPRNNVQMSIQLQLFETLQALNMQQQFVQHQIDWVLQPKYSELEQSLAALRALPNTDHVAYYQYRRQQQAVEQQINANRWTLRQIAERVEYTRDAYLKQVERGEMAQDDGRDHE